MIICDRVLEDGLKEDRLFSEKDEGVVDKVIKRCYMDRRHNKKKPLESVMFVNWEAAKPELKNPSSPNTDDRRRLGECNALFWRRIKYAILKFRPDVVICAGMDPFKYMYRELVSNDQRHKIQGRFNRIFKTELEEHQFKLMGTIDFGRPCSWDVQYKSYANLLGYLAYGVTQAMDGYNWYSINLPEPKVTYIDTIDKFKKFYQKLLASEIVAIDSEGSGNGRLTSKLFCLQFAFDMQRGYFLPLYHPDTPFTATELDYIAKKMRYYFEFESVKKYHIYQNGKYDVGQLMAQIGVRFYNHRVYDTMGGAWLDNQNIAQLKNYGVKAPYALDYIGSQLGCYIYEELEFSKGDRNQIAQEGFTKRLIRYACLAGSTLINTDKGLKKIEDMVEFSGKVGSRYKPVNIKKWMYNGNKKVVKIVTAKGNELTCTKDHEILVFDNSVGYTVWKEAKDCRKGDLLVINPQQITRKNRLNLSLSTQIVNGQRPELKKPTKMNEDLAFILACITAEGHINPDRYMLQFTNTNDKLINKFNSLMKKIFDVKTNILNVDDKINLKEGVKIYSNKCKIVTICSKTLFNWLTEMGLYVQKGKLNNLTASHYKTVPWSILQADYKSQLSFLAAYLECDGCIDNKVNGTISWTSRSKQLVSEIQIILNSHGYAPTITKSSTIYKGVQSQDYCLFLDTASARDFWAKIAPYMVYKQYKNTKNLRARYNQGVPANYWLALLKQRRVKAPCRFGSMFKNDKNSTVTVSNWPSKYRNSGACLRKEASSFLYDLMNTESEKKFRRNLGKVSKNAKVLLDKNLKNKYVYTKIVEITELEGEVPVYDLTVVKGQEPAFIANGLVVHNCFDATIMIGIHNCQTQRAKDRNHDKFILYNVEQVSDTLLGLAQVENTGALMDRRQVYLLHSKDGPINSSIQRGLEEFKKSKAAIKVNGFLIKKDGLPQSGMLGAQQWVFNINKPETQRLLFYEALKIKPLSLKKDGTGKVDKAFLKNYSGEYPEVKIFQDYKAACTLRNNFVNKIFKMVHEDPDTLHDGRIRSRYTYTKTTTGRLCLDGNSMVAVLDSRCLVPIKDIRPGDYVWSYNDELEPVVNKVKWQGRTKYAETVTISYKCYKSKEVKELICTPDHKIRLIDGRFVKAKDLKPNDRLLYLSRSYLKEGYRTIKFTNMKNNEYAASCARTVTRRGIKYKCIPTMLEHRFVSKTPLDKDTHHIDTHRDNNIPLNLEHQDSSEHKRYHALNKSDALRRKLSKNMINQYATRTREKRHLLGAENPNYINIDKEDLIKALKESKWRPVYAAKTLGIDYSVMQDRLSKFSIDILKERERYNGDNEYITDAMLKKASKMSSYTKAGRYLKVSYYKAKKLLEDNLNHYVISVTKNEGKRWTYDISIENNPNFIVNDICAANSSVDPNLQNLVARGDWVGHFKQAFISPRRCALIAADFSANELRDWCNQSNDEVLRSTFYIGLKLRQELQILLLENPEAWEAWLKFQEDKKWFDKDDKKKAHKSHWTVEKEKSGRSEHEQRVDLLDSINDPTTQKIGQIWFDIETKSDVHRSNAVNMYSLNNTLEVTDDQRYEVKAISFGKIFGKCVHGNAILPTSEGVLTLRELYLKNKRKIAKNGYKKYKITVMSHKGKAETSHVYRTKGKTHWFKTNYGDYVEGLPEHRMYVMRAGKLQFVRIDELQIGDWLPKSVGTHLYNQTYQTFNYEKPEYRKDAYDADLPEILDERVGDIFGWLVAEGCYSNGTFSNKDRRVVNHFKRYLDSIGATYSSQKRQDGLKTIRLNSVVADFFYRYIGAYKSGTIRVPKIIRQSPKSVQKAFLRSLFEGDGSIWRHQKTNNLLEYTSLSRKLVYDVKAMLENMGVLCTVYKGTAWATNGSENQVEKLRWRLFVANSHYKEFYENAGFMEGSPKQKMLKNASSTHQVQRSLGKTNIIPGNKLFSDLFDIMEDICLDTYYTINKMNRWGQVADYTRAYKLGAIMGSSHKFLAVRRDGFEGNKHFLNLILARINTAPKVLQEKLAASKKFNAKVAEINAVCEFTWSKVTAKGKSKRVKPVYDLVVPGPQSYHVCGLIGHNTIPSFAKPLSAGGLGKTEEECEVIMNNFDNTFKVGTDWLENNNRISHKQTYIESPLGARRYLDGFTHTRTAIINAMKRRSSNAIIQGTSANICTTSIRNLQKLFWHLFTKRDVDAYWNSVTNTVHDAIYTYSPISFLPIYLYLLNHSMTTLVHRRFQKTFGYKFLVGLEGEVNIGPTLAHCKKAWNYDYQSMYKMAVETIEYHNERLGYNYSKSEIEEMLSMMEHNWRIIAAIRLAELKHSIKSERAVTVMLLTEANSLDIGLIIEGHGHKPKKYGSTKNLKKYLEVAEKTKSAA